MTLEFTLLEKLQRLSKTAIWRWSFEEQTLTEWSKDWVAIFNTCDKDLNQDYEQMCRVVHPNDRGRVIESYLAADTAQSGFEILYRIVSRDGSLKVLHEIAEIERNADGRPIGQFGIVKDVTRYFGGANAIELHSERETHINSHERLSRRSDLELSLLQITSYGTIDAYCMELLQSADANLNSVKKLLSLAIGTHSRDRDGEETDIDAKKH